MRPYVVRVFTNFKVTNSTELLGRTVEDLSTRGIHVVFNKSGSADLAIVINSVNVPRWVRAPQRCLIKVLQEPVVHNPLTHLFTYRHSAVFDEILTHTPSPVDFRQRRSLPLNGTFIDPREVPDNVFEHKRHNLSIVASTLRNLAGHKRRADFIDGLLALHPELIEHTFGHGREKVLQRKIEGVLSYRYSIAIENSSLPSYLTEKFYDCILAGCVPIYFGAPDVGDYFPSDSFISLPIDDLEKTSQLIASLSDSDYEKRIPALLEARRLIREKYSLGSLILNRYQDSRELNQRPDRTTFLFRLDGLLAMLQRTGVTTQVRRLARKIHEKVLQTMGN